jgi:aminoglycoside phosphotransferase (APT) family kinase protein
MIDFEKFQLVTQKIDAQPKLLRAWELKGGISAQVTALEIEQPDGQIEKMIVRLHGAADRAENPNIAADEFKLLQHLHAAGLTVPKPYLTDLSAEIFDIPYIVIEFIDGETDFAPATLDDALLQLATHLASIHRVDAAPLTFLPSQEQKYSDKLGQRPAILDESLSEGRIRETLEAVWPLSRHNPSTLLHGDYWPGNVLWKAGHVAAVIDWEDAAIGDPLADVGNMRLELLWSFGVDAMKQFTQHYQAMNALDFTNLPYWDLCAALRPASKLSEWAGDAVTEKRMREGHHVFITQAFAKLAAG